MTSTFCVDCPAAASTLVRKSYPRDGKVKRDRGQVVRVAGCRLHRPRRAIWLDVAERRRSCCAGEQKKYNAAL